MLKKILLVVCIAAFSLTSSQAVAQLATDAPWPKFHHDLRNTGKTSLFGTLIGKLKWQFVTGKPITSSPAIDTNGLIYVGSADNNVYAINAETGTLEWKYTTGGAIVNSSPAIDEDGMLYIGSEDGRLYAFDTTSINPLDPEPAWTFQTGGAITSSPSIDEDGTIMFASSDGKFYAVDPGDGSLKWDPVTIGTSGCSPAIDPVNNQVYIGSWVPQFDEAIFFADNGTFITLSSYVNFFAIDTASGAVNWQFPGFCTPGGIFASPVIASDQSVLVSFFYTWVSDCEDEASKYNVWSLPYNYDEAGSKWALAFPGEDIYSTPAMLEDNSFLIGAGADMFRINPDGSTYLSTDVIGQRIESSPAIDGARFVFTGSNGGRFYCLHADLPETPIVWVYPPLDEDPLIDLVGTVASITSSPAIGNDDRHSVYVGAGDGNLYAFYDGPRIYGKIDLVETDDTGATTKTPLRAVKLTLTSEFAPDQTAYTDTNGRYEFAGVENFSYTVTPEKIGYVFFPTSGTALITRDQDAVLNFEAFTGFTLSGTIETEGGRSLDGVTVTLKGSSSNVLKTTTTDGTGAYSFNGLSFDTYIVTPALDNYGFSPPFREVSIDMSGNKANIDFIATLGFQVSGRVTSFTTSNGIQGVTMRLTGSTNTGQAVNDSTATEEDGAYSFVGLTSGTYTIVPDLTAFSFEPSQTTVTVAAANVDSVDFVAATGLSISGSVKIDGVCDNETLAEVEVDLLEVTESTRLGGDTTQLVSTVQPGGTCTFTFIGVDQNKTYIVKPRLAGYGFDPLAYRFTVTNSDVTNINFAIVSGAYISGRVTDLLGRGLPGILISLANDDPLATSTLATAVTRSDGIYSFVGLDPDEYIVSISDPSYTTLQPTRQVDLRSESRDDVDFAVSSVCTVAALNIPFVGGAGALVNIYGYNFGFSKPSKDDFVLFGESGTPLTAGVYFGRADQDPSTWAKADVIYWGNFKIVVEAPGVAFTMPPIVKVWVIRNRESSDSGCIQVLDTNFFMYIY